MKLASNTQHYCPIPIPDTAEDEDSRLCTYSQLKEELAKGKTICGGVKGANEDILPAQKVDLVR